MHLKDTQIFPSMFVRILIELHYVFYTDNMYNVAQPNYSAENAKLWCSISPTNKSNFFPCISDVFKYLQKTYGDEEISILVTGSLHLVGEFLRTIQD